MTSKTKSLVTILWIGLLAGTLDITDNLIFNELRGITPTMVLKQHKKVEEQEATIRQLSSILAEQQRVFTAHLKEQDSKIQAVNERLQRVAPLEVVDRK